MKKSIIDILKIPLIVSTLSLASGIIFFATSCSNTQTITGKHDILTYADVTFQDTTIGGSGGVRYTTSAKGLATWNVTQLPGPGQIKSLGTFSLSHNTCMLSWHAIDTVGLYKLWLVCHVDGYTDATYAINIQVNHFVTDVEDNPELVVDNLGDQANDIYSITPWEPHYLQHESTWFNKPDQWMAGLDPSAKLVNTNIPGTHDSTTMFSENIAHPSAGNILPGWSQDQAYTITEQLNAGMRTFDIRSQEEDGYTGLDSVCHHDISHCFTDNTYSVYLTERMVLNDICQWLNEPIHSHEIVFTNANSWATNDVKDYVNSMVTNIYYDSVTDDTTFNDIWNFSSGHGHIAPFPPSWDNPPFDPPQAIKDIQNDLYWNKLVWELPWKITQLLRVISGEYDSLLNPYTSGKRFDINTNSTGWNINVLRNDPRNAADLINKAIVNLQLPETFIGKPIGWFTCDTAYNNLSNEYSIAKKIYLTNAFIN